MAATFTILLRDMIANGWQDAPLQHYPVFDDTYRDLLNEKIKRHFMMREIGFETVELFDYSLQTKMGEIMPLYNQLYLTQKLQFDPLTTMKYHDVLSGSLAATGHSTETTANDVTSTGHTTADARSRAVQSDTPQTRLSGDEDYASGMSDATSQTTNDSTSDARTNGTNASDSTSDQTTATDRTMTGYSGASPSLLLRDYRAQLLNIDMMVITELEPLFMSLYDNGDSMSDVTVPGGFLGFGGIYGAAVPFPYYF